MLAHATSTKFSRILRANIPGFNIDNYSGISWRKAALSNLVGKVVDSRAANFADHQDIETTRKHYATDSISDRAFLSNVIAGP